MSAGEGEDGGLRAAPIVPDEAVDAVANPPDGYGDGEPPETAGADSPGNSDTQQLPMVRREGLGEPPSVRAVARRVASALPALGRDEITDAPRSARATAFRRRRAAAEGRAVPADASPATPNEPAVTGHAPGHPYPREPVADLVEPVAGMGEPGAEIAAAVVQPTAPNVRSVDLVIEPLSPAEPTPAAPVVPDPVDRPAELEPIAPDSRAPAHGMPVSRGGEVTATHLMGQPAAPDGDVLDAEILDDLPSSRSSVDAAAAEVLTSLTAVAFRDARSDEWIMGQPEPVREPSAALEPLRRGPNLLESDSWDTGSLPAIKQDAYQGRRRAATAGAKLWVVIGLVVTALSAAVAIPFLLTSSPLAPATARTPDGQVPAVDDELPWSSTSATSPAPAPAVGASPLITASPTVSSGASPSPNPPPLLTIQAEQGSGATVWGGTAGPPTSFAGALVVDELGEHWPGTSTDGWLEFRNFTGLSAGPYLLKIYYVYTNQAPEDGRTINAERRMRVIVNGAVILRDQVFSPVSTITELNVNVTLRAGSNTVRLTHPDFECPAVDRIEIFSL